MRKTNPEAHLQREIRATLCLLGYTVMETGKSRSRVTCAKCGASNYATGWQGNTPGLPDIYVHRPGWGRPLAVALELKALHGKPTETQQWLADNRMTTIVRSMEDALHVLRDVEAMLWNTEQVKKIDATLEAISWKHPTAKP